ncbi:LADA_0G16358g1_1 [Lachancea dasiensis]|uniref:LADA_0G16358g1_1 n=1 Tax=Lachancea dasiensis TaxID=1072105 RepID=A0A1G4JWY3_9SACH|nr:LADA_0G16358g1_1 [Lachancea dasiensis]
MRQTAVKLAQSYTPMIKFVGTKHPVLKHAGSAAHPCTVDGIMPGSEACQPAGDFLSKLQPFQVIPYKNKKASPGKSAAPQSGSKYEFVSRPLQENEVSSIFELSPRFKLRPFDESEIESINAGGAL